MLRSVVRRLDEWRAVKYRLVEPRVTGSKCRPAPTRSSRGNASRSKRPSHFTLAASNLIRWARSARRRTNHARRRKREFSGASEGQREAGACEAFLARHPLAIDSGGLAGLRPNREPCPRRGGDLHFNLQLGDFRAAIHPYLHAIGFDRN